MEVIKITLGFVGGLLFIGWPAMQVYHSWMVGWPIARLFEKRQMIVFGRKPSQRYKFGGLINLAIAVAAVWAFLEFGSKTLIYASIAGGLLILTVAILRTRDATIETHEEIYSDLNGMGQTVVKDDMKKYGVDVSKWN